MESFAAENSSQAFASEAAHGWTAMGIDAKLSTGKEHSHGKATAPTEDRQQEAQGPPGSSQALAAACEPGTGTD